jgi:hypothetical protein
MRQDELNLIEPDKNYRCPALDVGHRGDPTLLPNREIEVD